MFYKALTEDEEKKGNFFIFAADFLYLFNIIIFSLTYFDGFIDFSKDFLGAWNIVGYMISSIAFLIVFLVELVVTYWKTISGEIMGWFSYTFQAKRSVRVIGPWEVKSAEPVPDGKIESFIHSVEFKSIKD